MDQPHPVPLPAEMTIDPPQTRRRVPSLRGCCTIPVSCIVILVLQSLYLCLMFRSIHVFFSVANRYKIRFPPSVIAFNVFSAIVHVFLAIGIGSTAVAMVLQKPKLVWPHIAAQGCLFWFWVLSMTVFVIVVSTAPKTYYVTRYNATTVGDHFEDHSQDYDALGKNETFFDRTVEQMEVGHHSPGVTAGMALAGYAVALLTALFIRSFLLLQQYLEAKQGSGPYARQVDDLELQNGTT